MIEYFDKPHSFGCLISPPASGKTSFLLYLLDHYNDDVYQWIFISPLKALADEFANRLRDQDQILVLTAEKLKSDKYQYLFHCEKTIFIIDEFHLFYQWGFSFRQALLDIWYQVSISRGHVLALTATLESTLINEV